MGLNVTILELPSLKTSFFFQTRLLRFRKKKFIGAPAESVKQKMLSILFYFIKFYKILIIKFYFILFYSSIILWTGRECFISVQQNVFGCAIFINLSAEDIATRGTERQIKMCQAQLLPVTK